MNDTRICLFIDDDTDDQEIFKDAVYEIDHRIICYLASDCESAINILKTMHVKPDIIFLDLNMPRIPGKECLSQIKKMDDLADVPVIIYSTSSNEKDINECYDLGASFFLTKPSGFAELKQKLTGIFKGEVEYREASQTRRD